MVQCLNNLKESPSQTAGPYVHIGCTPNFSGVSGVYEEDLGCRMITGDAKGERITITGAVYDGTGHPLRDSLIEIWQADADGLHNSPAEVRGVADPHFTGFGRCASNMDTGQFTFETIKPGPVPFVDGRPQAPHVTFWVVARGINVGLHTRMYFPDEEAANSADPILSRIEHQGRVATLIATQPSPHHYTFDIRVQGEGETIFFDI